MDVTNDEGMTMDEYEGMNTMRVCTCEVDHDVEPPSRWCESCREAAGYSRWPAHIADAWEAFRRDHASDAALIERAFPVGGERFHAIAHLIDHFGDDGSDCGCPAFHHTCGIVSPDLRTIAAGRMARGRFMR